QNRYVIHAARSTRVQNRNHCPAILQERGIECFLRENDRKLGVNFARVAGTSRIEILSPPYQAPRANAFCERFLGSVRRECLNHILTLGEKHLHRVVKEFVQYYNTVRPHQWIRQAIPDPRTVQLPKPSTSSPEASGKVISFP